MNNSWIFFNGSQKLEFGSFPLAFRAMYHAINPRPSKGQPMNKPLDRKLCKITSPLKKDYSYIAAVQMAIDQELLSADGQINSREFKKR